MSENYLMLNGKRVDLTEEQIEKLGLKVEKDCFERHYEESYYCINTYGEVIGFRDALSNDDTGTLKYNVGNYCTDKELMQQRALHEILDRLLWRFSMQNDGDKINWRNKNSCKYYIYYSTLYKEFHVDCNNTYKENKVYFYTKDIAKRAIDEIVIPFTKEHPEFVW